jgi:uncharacterized membrane protein YphA (DoxX/SURF4 family)
MNSPATIPVSPSRYACACRTHAIVSWVAQVIGALILLQTLFFKFTGAPESIYIFQKVGMEPWGRYASGVVELVAAVLLLVPRTAHFGALLALGVITGAIGSHVTKLGITIPNQDGSPGDDGGLLFVLACVVFAMSLIVLIMRRRALPIIGAKFA